MNSHKGVKFGPVKLDRMSLTTFARSEELAVVLYHTFPVPLVSTSAKNGAIIELPCMGNGCGV